MAPTTSPITSVAIMAVKARSTVVVKVLSAANAPHHQANGEHNQVRRLRQFD